jgi:hypothetical protein
MSVIATPSLTLQDQFSTTTTATFPTSDTILNLNAVPTGSEGFLGLFTYNSTTAQYDLKEIIYYTSKGASTVTCPSATYGSGRGIYSSTGANQSFASGTVVRQVVNADYWKQIQSGAAIGAVLGSPNFLAGVPVQIVSTNYSAVAANATVMPWDDTIPQITEGDEYMSQVITPKSATNILEIEIVANFATTAAKMICGALFQDPTANAIAATATYEGAASASVPLILRHRMVAGTTSAITFKFRAGPETASTITMNGVIGVRKFGGITGSHIRVIEYKA